LIILLLVQGVSPIIASTANAKFGDYQCNNSMQLFAQMKGQQDAPYKNPRELATAIMEVTTSYNNNI
jgi:arginyl-tRNA synthetase